jgi:hypothetical protein
VQFGLSDVNAYLAAPPTPAEVRYTAATSITRDDSSLTAFPWEFPPAPAGSPPAVVLCVLRNTGRLPTDVSFELPHERESGVEPWADANPTINPGGDGAAAVSRPELDSADLINKGVFDVQPRRLRLAPGAAQTVRVHYSYITVGRASLAVVLRLGGAKSVRLQLRGHTLAANEPCICVASPRRAVRFAPVPIGTAEPPVQVWQGRLSAATADPHAMLPLWSSLLPSPMSRASLFTIQRVFLCDLLCSRVLSLPSHASIMVAAYLKSRCVLWSSPVRDRRTLSVWNLSKFLSWDCVSF